MTLFPSRRFDRVPRAKFDAITAALTRERDAALEKARTQSVRLAAFLERKAGAYDEDAAYLERAGMDLNATTPRAVAAELRGASREIEQGP